jgi:hypothetical protein
MLTAANGEVRFTHDFGTNLADKSIGYFTDKFVIVSTT